MRESQLIAKLMRERGQLVATGGGAVLSAQNRQLLRAHGFVVYLKVSVGQQLERLARDRTRPLLATDDKQGRLEALAATRNALYEEVADLVFDSDGLAVATACDRVDALVQSRWQRGEAA